jgi:GNAT superfamily N-acetyltransferase
MPSIRRAALTDLPRLIDLVGQLGYKTDPSALKNNLLAYLENPRSSVLIAELEGIVAGCLAYDMAPTFHREGKHFRVVSLVVDLALRGKGIGKKLLRFAEEIARKEGCWVIELTSSSRREKEGTHEFYVKEGYQKNGEQAYFRKTI